MAKSEESSTNLIIITETGTITSAQATDAAFVGQPYSLVTTFDPSLIQAIPPGSEQAAYHLESGSTTLIVGATSFNEGQNDVGYSATSNFSWSPSPASTGSPAALSVGDSESFEYDFVARINNPVTPIPNPSTVSGTFSTMVNPITPPPMIMGNNIQGDYITFEGASLATGIGVDVAGNITNVTINDVFAPPDSLVAAVLSEEVYHSGNESISPPPGWEEVGDYYDASTGYYGEAWGKLSVDANGNPIPGSPYTEIIQVNRGTVFTDMGPGAPVNVPAFTNPSGISVPGVNLGDTAVMDSSKTWAANEQIVIGQQPSYMASADAFYNELREFYQSLPIIETGQSLGGATSDSIVAENYTHDSNLTAITFNALPYGQGIAGLSSAQASALSTPTDPDDPTTATITNYYVGNEQVTQGYLVQAVLWAFGGTALGNSLSLPDLSVLDVNTQLEGRVQEIHDASAGISQLFQSLYPQGSTYNAAALAWLTKVFPTAAATGTPKQISAVLNGTFVPTDQSLESVIFNRNDTVSLVIGGDGSLADAQQIETVSQSQAATSDTYQVISVPPDTLSDEQDVWETDAYNSASQLVGITQSKVYTDGSFSVYTFNPNRVLQNIYSAQSTGDTLVQTYSATGDLNASVDYTPNGTVVLKQYQGDPTLISNSTIDIGTAAVYEITEDSDQSILTELDYGATATNSGIFVGVVANSDGSADIVDGQGEDGTSGDIINFGTAGLADDTLSIAQAATGSIDVTLDIEPGADTDISSNQNLSGVQEDFSFTGESEILQIGTPSAFTGTILNFQPGNTIDLAGVSATGATLGADNVLTIQESSGGPVTLQLDSAQNFASDLFLVSPDGNGGTNVTVQINPFTTLVGPASGINNGGTVLGDGYLENDGSYATLSGPFVVTFFDGLNDSGELVGTYVNVPGSISPKSFYGFIEANGVYTTLDDPMGDFTERGTTYSDTSAYGINDSDVVVGTYALHGFVESGGVYTTLDDPNAGPSFASSSLGVTTAYAINNQGTVAGIYDNSTGEHGFIESGGVYTTIDEPNASGTTVISGINDSGTVVGYYVDINGIKHGFFESDGIYTTLDVPNGTLTTPEGINNGGTVVGSYSAGGVEFGFEYTPPGGVTCFQAGTRIATERGEMCVEALEVGNLVKTGFSRLQPVKWIGYRRVDCSRHPDPRKVWPVRVAASAFGEDLPRRDLWLSPDHAVYVNKVLIPIKHLINGMTIEQVPMDEVTYYHIEVDQHDVLLAEDLPAESYLDTGDRSKFANGGGPIALHPDFSACMWEAMGCAPLVVTGSALASVRARLERRAAHLAVDDTDRQRVAIKGSCAA